jgi:hypothetical protein
MHWESCKGSKATKEYSYFPKVEGDMQMFDVFTGLLLVALIGGGFMIARRLFDRRHRMNPPMEMPWQSEYGPGYGRPMYGPDYGEPRHSRPAYGPGYDPAGYGRPMYGPGYPPQTGMSPWAAGGLGAVGGGLLGYELGRMTGEHDQSAAEGDAGNPDQMATLDAGGYDPGMADSVGAYDAGAFSDFGGGDFGGIEMS